MQKQHLTQTQGLRQLMRLSPAQVRYFRMLEMNADAADEEVERELAENPALASGSDASDAPVEASIEAQTPLEADPTPIYLRRADNRDPDADTDRPATLAAETETLVEALRRQLRMAPGLDADTRAAAEYIAASLDASGYLRLTLPELRQLLWQAAGRQVPDAVIRRALDAVRSLDPPGVGAVDLRDCLLLQMRGEQSLARTIVADYFDLLSLKHYDRLADALGVTRADLTDALSRIRALNPRPAAAYAADFAPAGLPDAAEAVRPDFMVDIDDESGQITLTMPDRHPQLHLEESFGDDALTALDPASAGAAFIRSRRDDARAFIDIVRLRRHTLMRVMSAIVRLQRDFFLSGDEARLRPMVLRDVAALTGIDPSSISRATAGKYVATPYRTYPLRHFFSERAGVSTDASQHAVRQALRDIIEAEPADAPLSDEALRAALEARGLKVARRTVTKHREALAIPVARLRRKP